mmetsp:Transcript_20715/g.48936  ORF Transcript_20715/g.48936 Transcript_20715/m.48936 type:complete len:81 (+) Transcript_20715:1073-1315(+)
MFWEVLLRTQHQQRLPFLTTPFSIWLLVRFWKGVQDASENISGKSTAASRDVDYNAGWAVDSNSPATVHRFVIIVKKSKV